MPPRPGAIRYEPEEHILKPTEADRDEWPNFVLHDAAVYRPDGETMANALLVDTEGPFVIRGHLEVDEPSDFASLVRPSVREADIEIVDCLYYSIGYNPEAVLWLAGKAGWYEINPRPAYAAIYKDICDVAKFYHIFVDIYSNAFDQAPKSERRKVYAALDVREVLFEYAVAVGDGITYDEVVEKMLRLGPALLAHFDKATDVPWRLTSVYNWLARELKNRERTERSSSRGTSQPPSALGAQPRGSAPFLPAQGPSPASASASSQQLPYRASSTTARAESPVYTPPDTMTVTDSGPVSPEEREAVFRAYLKIIHRIGDELGNPRRLTAGKVHANFYQQNRVKEYNLGKYLTALFGNELLAALDPKYDDAPFRAYINSREALSFLPASDAFLRDVPRQMVRRQHVSQHFSQHAASPIGSAGPSSLGCAAGSGSGSIRTAGKRAVLRPPVGPVKRSLDDDDDDDDNNASRHRSSTPRSFGRPKKSARNTADDTAIRSPAVNAHADADNAHVANDADADAGAADADAMDTDSSDSSDSDTAAGDDAVTFVHAQPVVVSTRPTGANRTWTCPHHGCDFSVRNAGTPDTSDDDDDDDDDENDDNENDNDAGSVSTAQKRVRKHLRAHEEESFSRVDLAIAEGSRKQVPVDNLLAKIRALADKKDQARDAPPAPTTTGFGSSSILRRFFF